MTCGKNFALLLMFFKGAGVMRWDPGASSNGRFERGKEQPPPLGHAILGNKAMPGTMGNRAVWRPHS